LSPSWKNNTAITTLKFKTQMSMIFLTVPEKSKYTVALWKLNLKSLLLLLYWPKHIQNVTLKGNNWTFTIVSKLNRTWRHSHTHTNWHTHTPKTLIHKLVNKTCNFHLYHSHPVDQTKHLLSLWNLKLSSWKNQLYYNRYAVYNISFNDSMLN
jgi:hypothetical protein